MMIKLLKNKLQSAARVKSKNITLTVEEVQDIIIFLSELQTELLDEKNKTSNLQNNVVSVSIKPEF